MYVCMYITLTVCKHVCLYLYIYIWYIYAVWKYLNVLVSFFIAFNLYLLPNDYYLIVLSVHRQRCISRRNVVVLQLQRTSTLTWADTFRVVCFQVLAYGSLSDGERVRNILYINSTFINTFGYYNSVITKLPRYK